MQELFLAGDRESATALIPDDLSTTCTSSAPRPRCSDTVQAWEGTGVTTLMLSAANADEIKRIAEVLA